MRRTSGAETAMRMTSRGTDEIEIEIEIEIFRHSPRRDGTARGLCHFQLRTRVWIEMFESSVGIPTGGCVFRASNYSI
jgi:hypothetical protein